MTLPPPADAPAAVSVAAEASPASTLPPPADAAIVVAPAPADAAIVVAPECPDTPVVPIPKWLPAALGDEPGDAKPSFYTDHKHGPKCESDSRLSNEAIGIQPIPERPPLIVELNDHFLSPGFLSKGIELPTGEIVRPSLYVFGTTSLATTTSITKPAPRKPNELVDRLDLYAQLNLTATERVLVELRPLDKEDNSKLQHANTPRRFPGRPLHQRHECHSRKRCFSRAISARSSRSLDLYDTKCSTTASPSAGSRC